MTHDCPVALCVDLAAPARPAKPVDCGYDPGIAEMVEV